MKLRSPILSFLVAFLTLTTVSAQEDDPILPYNVAPQNLLKYNRFLINPTFSTVQEDKSYINLLHRNQSVQFQDNDQTYFLSYSGRIGDRSGLGISVYNQKIGPISNIGILTNFAYGIKLSDKSNFTFGGNLAYYNTGLNRNNVSVIDDQDFRLNGTQDSNILSFQPGFNISYGQFDFGVFAENLFDYNLKTSESLTEFADKTYSGHLQYTHKFDSRSGIFEDARLMPLARVRLNGQRARTNEGSTDVSLGGNLILDLPKLGWLQGGYDSFYGAAAGIGFNLNKRLSLGYTFEKGFSTDFNNLGVTHEISFAYSFTPTLTEDRVMLEDNEPSISDMVAISDSDDLSSNDEIEELKRKLEENNSILQELLYRQDSTEAQRQKDLERRYEMVMRMVRNETNGSRPDVEKRAKEIFFKGEDSPAQITSVVQKDKVQETNTPKSKIKTRKFTNLSKVKDGFYLVANVFKSEYYAKRFLNKLDEKGFESGYIDNPENKLKYVYLSRYNTWQEAVDAYESHINGKYDGELWVMDVDNRNMKQTSLDNVDQLKQKSSKYEKDVLQRNVVTKDRIATNDTSGKTYKLKGIDGGFYLIANVFANPKNANRFVKLLNSYGLSASYFINPENNWRYVYLKKHESWNNALLSYYTKLNESYDDKMWIMRVKPNLLA